MLQSPRSRCSNDPSSLHEYLDVCILSSSNKGVLVPASASDHLEKNGYQYLMFGQYKFPFNTEVPQFVPNLDTFLPLPWKREIAWLQW